MSTKKIPALPPIPYKLTERQLVLAVFDGMTKRDLVTVCKARAVPVAKDKFCMADRLATDIISRGQTINLVVK